MLDRLAIAWTQDDYTVLFTVLVLICSTLAVYVMQTTGHDKESQMDPFWVRWGRRSSVVLIMMGLLWRASFAYQFGYPPTPSEFLVVISMILMFGIRAFILHIRKDDQIIHDTHVRGLSAKQARGRRIHVQ